MTYLELSIARLIIKRIDLFRLVVLFLESYTYTTEHCLVASRTWYFADIS